MNEKGTVLIMAMVVLVMILFLAGIFLQLALINIMHMTVEHDREVARWIALAGINKQVYKLRQYYFLHQYDTMEEDFGEGNHKGKYKVATATLIGQGFHRTLIVGIGEYRDYKTAISLEVEMNTPSDFLYFTTTTRRNFYVVAPGGPVHINGDIEFGLTWDPTSFVKSVNDYGPVISVSGKIYITGVTDPTPSGWEATRHVYVGEGNITDGWNYNRGDGPSNYVSPYYFKIADRQTMLWPAGLYNPKAYPTLVKKIGVDGKEYSYPILQDRDNGGIFIKNAPPVEQLSWKNFRQVIDEDWHITSAKIPPLCKTTYIINELFDGFTGTQNPIGNYDGDDKVFLGYIFPGPAGFELDIPSDIDPDYVKYVMFKNEYLKNPDGSFYYAHPVGFGQNGHNSDTPGLMTSYTIDRVSKKIKFQYPLVWDEFVFTGPPIGGKWRGRRLAYTIGSGYPDNPLGIPNGQPNQQITLPTSAKGYILPPIPQRYLPFVNSPSTDPVTLDIYDRQTDSDYSGWKEVSQSDLHLYDDTKRIFLFDHSTNTITFAIRHMDPVDDPTTPYDDTQLHQHGALPPYGTLPDGTPRYVIRNLRFSFDFPTKISAWLHKKVKVVKLDLSNIDENNCPRDPRYPNDKNKYGIIYSEMPLAVRGIPKVPVTIFCTKDVYCGPINYKMLREKNVDNHDDIIDPGYKEDDPRAQPVGIICQGTLFLDATYAPLDTTASPKSNYIAVNTFVDVTDGKPKKLVLNKVLVYYSALRNTNENTQLPIFVMGGACFNRGKYWAGEGFCEPSMINDRLIGTMYECFTKSILENSYNPKVVGGWYNLGYYRWGDRPAGPRIYASSFRVKPPPHIPNHVSIVSYRGVVPDDLTEKFYNNLKDYYSKNKTEDGYINEYTAEFANTISKYLEDIEKTGY